MNLFGQKSLKRPRTAGRAFAHAWSGRIERIAKIEIEDLCRPLGVGIVAVAEKFGFETLHLGPFGFGKRCLERGNVRRLHIETRGKIAEIARVFPHFSSPLIGMPCFPKRHAREL